MSRTLRLLLPLFLGAFALLPSSAFASVIAAQYGNDVASTNTLVDGGDGFAHWYFAQRIGTGYSQPVGSITIYASTAGKGLGFIALIACTSSSYTGCTQVLSGNSSTPTISSTPQPLTVDFTGSGYTMNPSDYYYVSAESNSGNTHSSVYGTNSSSLYPAITVGNDGYNPGLGTDQETLGFTNAYFEVDTNSTPTPPTPPTSGTDNEVTSYIPHPGVATSTGVTTVGANFSIGNMSWINYFGYRIIAPDGTVVYDSSTTPTANGLYSISTNYDFTQSGLYTGHAYFAQTIGGNNWEVDNPTIQQIAVNLPQWSVSPDGTFTQNPATTSTTTLPNLTIDCGTGFAGSICNAIASLVVPKAASLQLVQSAFGALTQKAPFSFFTQAQGTLNGLNNASSTGSTGGSLSIYVYSDTINVISTTTANNIGVGGSTLAFMKWLMATGLWILFAWFLYWRIASIFGV